MTNFKIVIAYLLQLGLVHPRTGHESPEAEYRHNSTLSLTSKVDGSWWSTPSPGRFTAGKYPVGWAPGPVWKGMIVTTQMTWYTRHNDLVAN